MDKGQLVICGSNAYNKKYYLNERFVKLPLQIKQELQIMCVLFTEEAGGIITVEADRDGNLLLRTEYDDADFDYDEIGAALKIKKLQAEKAELLGQMEVYCRYLLGKI